MAFGALAGLVILGWLKAHIMLRDPSHPQYAGLPDRWKRPPSSDRGDKWVNPDAPPFDMDAFTARAYPPETGSRTDSAVDPAAPSVGGQTGA